LAKQRSEFTREKKREERLKRRLLPAGVKLDSLEIHQFKATQLMKTINRNIFRRVPVTILPGTCTACRAGINQAAKEYKEY
jgi:hypothetical protein